MTGTIPTADKLIAQGEEHLRTGAVLIEMGLMMQSLDAKRAEERRRRDDLKVAEAAGPMRGMRTLLPERTVTRTEEPPAEERTA